MNPAELSIECLGPRPSRPPRRAYAARLTMKNAGAEAVWFILPAFLDQPMVQPRNDLEAIDLMKGSGGELYLTIHRRPSVAVFRVAPGRTVTVADWTFAAWDETTTVEAWAAADLRFSGVDRLPELIDPEGRLVVPAEPPEGPAQLASIEPEGPASWEVLGKIERFRLPLG